MTTMNISLPDSLKDFVDEQVSQRGYGRRGGRRLFRLSSASSQAGRPDRHAEVSVGRVCLRLQAQRDIDDAVDYCLRQGAGPAALALIDALEQAAAHLGRHPAIGSLRYAHELNLPGLRCWPLRRYPHPIFDVEHDDHVDVWRVLHAERDIPPWMHGTANI